MAHSSKSSLYSRYYAEACNEGGAHLRDLAPGLHSSEKTSQRWRHCVDLTGPGIEPQTSRTDSVSLATELTAGLSAIIYCRLLISFKIVLIYRLLILLL